MMRSRNIPFCDLKKQYLSIKKEVDKAIKETLTSGRYILGKEGNLFEQEFSNYCGSSFGIGVASGTEALYISLLTCDVRPGDEVITVANAGVPTVCAITMAGAVPVFVDINSETYNIDVLQIERKITSKTKAIIPVHLYGQCADMDPIIAIAKKYNLRTIEDACQGHGAMYKGKKAGSIAEVGCFSFYPTKNLGAYGDGGMIVANSRISADRAKILRDYGQKERYDHKFKGINSRLDEIQAAILRVKLKLLDKWNKRRIEIAGIYNGSIANKSVIKPVKKEYGLHIYHLYVIACECRNKLRQYLMDNGIQTLIHYPLPVYMQEAYAELRTGGICPTTEKCAKTVLSLPIYPEMTEEDASDICEAINGFSK